MAYQQENVKRKQGELLEAKHENVIENVKKLQELEKYMYANLQSLNSNNDPNNNKKKIIEKRINELTTMRTNLFKKMKSMFVNTQASMSSNRKDLADQITMVSVMEEELNNIKNRLTQLKSERSNKIRMVQLGDYEYDRYNAHKKILKTIVYGAFILLILSYLFKFAWFPNKIGGIGIVLTISWVIINISSQIYDNARKDNIDYEKYDQGDTSMYNKDGVVGIGNVGFWNRNSDAFEKLFSGNKCVDAVSSLKNAKKDGFRNIGGFSKVVIPIEQPTTYAPITIY
jgi:hypothetical protein